MQNYINLAFYNGKQWIGYNKSDKRLVELPRTKVNEIRYTANWIRKMVRVEFAKLTKNNPIMLVVPASNSEEDKLAAEKGEKVVEWLEAELDLQEADADLLMWGLTTDVCFIQPFWNPSKGDLVEKGTKGLSDLHQGDVDYDIINAFEAKYDQSAKRWKDVMWFAKERIRTVDYVKLVYGEIVEPEDNLIDSNNFETQLKSLNNNFSDAAYKPVKNSVKVLEMWYMPDLDYPLGRRVTKVEGKVIQDIDDIGFGELDKTKRRLPFFPFSNISIPGSVQGASIIEDLIPIQKEYNRARSQIIQNKDLVASPKWIIEDFSMDEEPDDTMGQVLYYHQGTQPPHLTQPPSMGADVYQNITQIRDEFFQVSGQQDLSTARQTGVTSAQGLSLLQEQGDTVIAPTIMKYIRCKQDYVSYFLNMVKCKYDVARTLKIVGKNNEVDLFEFKGSDLTSTDVRVQPGSMQQLSLSAKREFVISLVNQGVLNAQSQNGLIMEMLEFGTIDDAYDEIGIDIDQAKSEQLKWNRGDLNTITFPFYNHAVHMSEHDKFRKSSDYLKLGQAMQVIDAHVKGHLDAIIAATQPQMAPQMAPQQLGQEVAPTAPQI